MRFKDLLSEKYIILLFAVYILFLGFSSDLDLYVHPRYIVFTVAMSAIGLLLITKSRSQSFKVKIGDLPMLVLLVLTFLLPARTLTSATFSQRTIDSGSLVTTTQSTPIDQLFSNSSKGLKLIDWSRLLSSNQDPEFYNAKPVNVSGLIIDADLGSNTFFLGQFVLTCCAVDAQPIGVPVRVDDWQNNFSEDEWVQIEGSFMQAETADGQEIVLIPDTIEKIDEPDNPYAN